MKKLLGIVASLVATGALVTALVMALAGARALREVGSARVLCPSYDGGAASRALVTCGAGGFQTVACVNASNTAIHFGGSTVDTTNGYPVCTGCSAGATISMDTSQGQLYCTSTQDSVDGGMPLICICGS